MDETHDERNGRNAAETAERAARLRAARAFAGKRQQEVADHLGVHAQTIKRMENGNVSISDERLFMVGKFCGVPRRFMTHGFANDVELSRALETAERERDAIRAEFTAAFDRVREAAELGQEVAARLRGGDRP